MKEQLLRQLPSIQKLLALEGVASSDLPRWALLEAAREAVTIRREAIQQEKEPSPIEASEILMAAQRKIAPSLRGVVNATGVVLHTNLGRAPLAQEAIERVIEVAKQYSNLEYNLSAGERGSRHDHVAALVAELTGAEDAAIVNNNAAAVLLVLGALASGGSVIVSRGELVEIGGSFRIPEILELSGSGLIEVGATNRTHLRDYEKVLLAQKETDRNEILGILRVHRSNFALVGFTSEPSRKELVEICKRHQKHLLEDLGSGCLLDEWVGGQKETTAQEAIAEGADIVTISGDKMLGGPQAGIVLGRRELIARIKKYPLARAVRVDKLTLAALEATLMLYRDQRTSRIPVWSMFRASQEELTTRAKRLAEELSSVCPRGTFAVEPVIEKVGGGAMPLSELKGAAIVCRLEGHSAQRVEKMLRAHQPPIICRVERDQIYLHLRTILPHQAHILIDAFRG